MNCFQKKSNSFICVSKIREVGRAGSRSKHENASYHSFIPLLIITFFAALFILWIPRVAPVVIQAPTPRTRVDRRVCVYEKYFPVRSIAFTELDARIRSMKSFWTFSHIFHLKHTSEHNLLLFTERQSHKSNVSGEPLKNIPLPPGRRGRTPDRTVGKPEETLTRIDDNENYLNGFSPYRIERRNFVGGIATVLFAYKYAMSKKRPGKPVRHKFL